jgi:hypothetical protein
MKNGASVEIGTIGREGMYSVSAILNDHTPFQAALVHPSRPSRASQDMP